MVLIIDDVWLELEAMLLLLLVTCWEQGALMLGIVVAAAAAVSGWESCCKVPK